MVKTIYVTRHGYRSNWVLDKPMPPPPTGILADPVLAEHGLEQAAELGAHMKHLLDIDYRPVQQIYCSPYYRCLQTATPTSKALGVQIFVENGASEWLNHTHYDQSPLPASTKDLARKYFPGNLISESYEPIITQSHAQETYDQLLDRAKLFIKNLIERLEKEDPDVENILIVTHAATKIVLGRAITGDDQLDVRTGTCSLDTYTRDSENPDKWIAESIGDTSFLSHGEEMHWSFDNNFAPGSTEDIKARMMASDSPIKVGDSSKTDGEEMVDVFLTLDLSQVYDSIYNELGSISMSRLSRHSKDFQNNQLDEEEDEFDEEDALLQEYTRSLTGTSNQGSNNATHIRPDPGIASLIRKRTQKYTKNTRHLHRTGASAGDEGNYDESLSELLDDPFKRGFKNGRRGGGGHEKNLSTIAKDTSLQIVDLASDHPLIRVGNELHIGVWEDTVGTDLFVDADGQVVGKSRNRIRLVPAKAKARALHLDENVSEYNKNLFEDNTLENSIDREDDDDSCGQDTNDNDEKSGQILINDQEKDTQGSEDLIKESENIEMSEDSKTLPISPSLKDKLDTNAPISDSPADSKSLSKSPPPFTPQAKKAAINSGPLSLLDKMRAINKSRIEKEGPPVIPENTNNDAEHAKEEKYGNEPTTEADKEAESIQEMDIDENLAKEAQE